MFTVWNNVFTSEQIIELAKVLGHPINIGGPIEYARNIKNIREFSKVLKSNRIDRIEIVGTWGKSMTWSMGRNHEWNNSAGIVSVTW